MPGDYKNIWEAVGASPADVAQADQLESYYSYYLEESVSATRDAYQTNQMLPPSLMFKMAYDLWVEREKDEGLVIAQLFMLCLAIKRIVLLEAKLDGS